MEPTDPLSTHLHVAQKGLRAALEALELGLTDQLTLAWQPAASGKGDLALPCFGAAKRLGLVPSELAQRLATALKAPLLDRQPSLFKGLHVEGGFVNLDFDWSGLTQRLLEAVAARTQDYGRGQPTGRRVLLEHTSANPTGPLHVGRARNPLIGDALARLLAYAGEAVTTEYYVNDVGRQAAVLTYGLDHFPPPEDDRKADHRLVESYQKANAAMEADPEARQAIYALLSACEGGDPEALARVKAATAQVLAGMQESLAALGVELDRYFFESELLASGAVTAIIGRLKELEAARTDEGAHYLDLAGHKLPSRQQRFVFTRASGLSLYTTRDLAYHLDKFARCDLALDVLGEDHKLQARQLAAALQLLGEPTPQVVFYSFVSLPEGRMSTRRGRAVHLDDLLAESRERAAAELAARRPDLPAQERQRLAAALGRAALRFNLLKVQPEKPLTFRWSEALSFEGFAAPYILYSHARACAILRKAGLAQPTGPEAWEVLAGAAPAAAAPPGAAPSNPSAAAPQPTAPAAPASPDAPSATPAAAEDQTPAPGPSAPAAAALPGAAGSALGPLPPKAGELLSHPTERALVKLLAGFPSLVQMAAASLRPHAMPNFLYELATAFNQFYRDCPVLAARSAGSGQGEGLAVAAPDDQLIKARLHLVAAARQVLANALGLMGIEPLERM